MGKDVVTGVCGSGIAGERMEKCGKILGQDFKTGGDVVVYMGRHGRTSTRR